MTMTHTEMYEIALELFLLDSEDDPEDYSRWDLREMILCHSPNLRHIVDS